MTSSSRANLAEDKRAGTAGPDGSPRLDFASILAPVTIDEFFNEYHGRKPLYIPGDPAKFRGVMDWGRFNRLLNMTSIWSSESLRMFVDGNPLTPEQYCSSRKGRDLVEVMQPDAVKVQQIMGSGAALVAHNIDELTPELIEIAGALEDALQGVAECNLYCSSQESQALTTHYDPHDVFALHCEGEKLWQVYEKAEDPINHPRFIQVPKKTHEKNRGAVNMKVRMTPGDVLYLPRGQYHDALATSESALHLTFGIVKLTGLDLIQLLTDLAIGDKSFRRDLPLPREGREVLRDHVGKLSERLVDLAGKPQLLDEIIRLQQHHRFSRGGFELPVKALETLYQRVDSSASIVQRQGVNELKWSTGVAAVPPKSAAVIGWIISKPQFSNSALRKKFPQESAADVELLLEDLQHMGIIRKVRRDQQM